MCDLAPFYSKCIHEKYICMECRIHKLIYLLNLIEQLFPIFGRFIKPYRCPDFELEE